MATKFAGIGSRRTPPHILEMMTALATVFAEQGIILRSGGAPGADLAFENGYVNHTHLCEIFIPWKGFNGSTSQLYEVDPHAFKIAAAFHPAWSRLSPAVRNLMARNVHQVLGTDLFSPVDFVLCYTPDGCDSAQSRSKETGGTGMAIAIASTHNIPVFNLQKPDILAKFQTLL